MEFQKNEDIEKIIKHINNKIKNRKHKESTEKITKLEKDIKINPEEKINEKIKKFHKRKKINLLKCDELTLLRNTNQDLRLIILEFQEKIKNLQNNKKINKKKNNKLSNSILQHKKFINSKLLEEKKKIFEIEKFKEKNDEIKKMKEKNLKLKINCQNLKKDIIEKEKKLPTKETQNLLIKFKEDNRKLFSEKNLNLKKIKEQGNFINKLNEILKNKDKNIEQLEKDYLNVKKNCNKFENEKKNLEILNKKYEEIISDSKKIIEENKRRKKIVFENKIKIEGNNNNFKDQSFRNLDFLRINKKTGNDENTQIKDKEEEKNTKDNYNPILIKNLRYKNYYENTSDNLEEKNNIKKEENLNYQNSSNKCKNCEIEKINLESEKKHLKNQKINFEREKKNFKNEKINLEDLKNKEIRIKQFLKHIEVYKKEITFYKKENSKLQLINKNIKDNKFLLLETNKEDFEDNFGVIKFRSDINSHILGKKNSLKVFENNISNNKIMSAFYFLKKENEELKIYVKEITDTNSRNVDQIHLLLKKISEYEKIN